MTASTLLIAGAALVVGIFIGTFAIALMTASSYADRIAEIREDLLRQQLDQSHVNIEKRK